MQQQPPRSTDERLTFLEQAVADLQREREMQDERDAGLLARVDGAFDTIKRVERVQLRLFDEMKADHQELVALVKEQGTRLDLAEKNIGVLAQAQRQHKDAIEAVAGRVEEVAGQVGELTTHVVEVATVQQKILALLGGGQDQQKKTND